MRLVLIGAGVIKTKDGLMFTDARMKDAVAGCKNVLHFVHG
jgi:hypothetical protein